MTVGARRVFACAAVVCAACLVDAAGLRAQTAPERVPMVEETFKTVQLLRGIPVDTFFEVMGTFASSMGNDCTFCHASNAALDKSAFATQTPRIQRARQMITMVKAINQQYFGGSPRVTCFTCHGGSNDATIHRRRSTYDIRSEAGVCRRRGCLRGESGDGGRSAGTDRP